MYLCLIACQVKVTQATRTTIQTPQERKKEENTLRRQKQAETSRLTLQDYVTVTLDWLHINVGLGLPRPYRTSHVSTGHVTATLDWFHLNVGLGLPRPYRTSHVSTGHVTATLDWFHLNVGLGLPRPYRTSHVSAGHVTATLDWFHLNLGFECHLLTRLDTLALDFACK